MAAIQARQEEHPLPETELIQCIWTGLIKSIEWSARPDQHEGLIIKEVAVRVFLPPVGFFDTEFVCFFLALEVCGNPRTVL